MLNKIETTFPGVSVLVADDYELNQEVTEEMLTLMECSVDIAQDGEEAVRMHQEKKYDMIFMDVQMPLLDGYEATKQIRQAEGDAKHTPIIAITANALAGDRDACLKCGMDDYISKPIRGEHLEAVLTKYINKQGA